MSRPHIVIVGAGFGGVYTAKHLLPFAQEKLIDITIINRTNYFLFTPLLHEVATGGLRATSVSESLREIFKDKQVSIYQSEVKSIDTLNKKIQLENQDISYDYLVVATGAETNYYDIPGAKENTLPLKNLLDAINIRNKIINSFEKASLSNDENERKSLLSFVVVGGGATGVETVAELAEFVMEIKNRFYKKNKKYHISAVSLNLVNSGKELLKAFNKDIQKIAEKRLKKLGVNLILDTKVESVGKNSIIFSDGSSIFSETIIWTAGVIPLLPKFLGINPVSDSGRIKTNPFLVMEGQNNIFVLGDSSEIQYLEGKSVPPPMLAQVAVAEAKILAKNIMSSIQKEPLTQFNYRSKGSFLSLGQWFAAGEVFGFTINGKITWWIWRTTYLSKFVSWNKRLHIIFGWTIDLFYPRDITKLI